MRKLLSGFAILITLITGFIAFMFYHEPSSNELVGRSVALDFGPKHEFHISKLGSQFIASDTSFSNSKFPYPFDAYVVKNKGKSSYLYLLCKDNMIVFDKNMNCILFFSKQNQESKALLDHVKKYYHFDESKTKYKIEDLDEVDKSIYLSLRSQN
ncbi:MAG: hypothetical protein HXP23_06340 [Veillonella sp.]|nr:hypothetical protein [Veillonella sp.]